MKLHKYFIAIILMYGCNNPTSPKIPNELPNEDLINYDMNLSVINPGSQIETVNLEWNIYNESDFIKYEITNENNDNIITLTDKNEHNCTIDMPTATFQKIYLTIELESNIIKDSIEIFTRDITPITNFSGLANVDDWSTSLTWTPTDEIDSIFLNYKIYRLNSLDYNQFSDLENCNCKLTELSDKSNSSYIDNGDFNLGEEYFYLIQTNTLNNNSRSSFIQSNLSSIDYSCMPTFSQTPTPNASQSEYNKIILNWSHSLNETEFYELQIWRSESEEINPLNGTLLISITDFNKNDFSDYYNIGDGTAWFYKIKLIDVHGNESITDIIMGNSHP